jgi:hypothetical protein
MHVWTAVQNSSTHACQSASAITTTGSTSHPTREALIVRACMTDTHNIGQLWYASAAVTRNMLGARPAAQPPGTQPSQPSPGRKWGRRGAASQAGCSGPWLVFAPWPVIRAAATPKLLLGHCAQLNTQTDIDAGDHVARWNPCACKEYRRCNSSVDRASWHVLELLLRFWRTGSIL